MAGSAQETDQLTEWVSQRLPIVDGRSTPMLQNSEEQEAWLEQRSSALGLQPNTVKRMVGAELQRLNADIDEDLLYKTVKGAWPKGPQRYAESWMHRARTLENNWSYCSVLRTRRTPHQAGGRAIGGERSNGD